MTVYEDFNNTILPAPLNEQNTQERARYQVIDWKKHSIEAVLHWPFRAVFLASYKVQMFLSAAKTHLIVVLYKVFCIPEHLFEKEKKCSAHYAAMYGRIWVLEAFYQSDKKTLIAKDFLGRNPMHLAALKGQFEAMEFFLKRRIVDVDEVDKGGNTLIHMIAKNSEIEEEKRTEVLETLINQYQARKHFENEEGNTPYFVAEGRKVKELLEDESIIRDGVAKLRKMEDNVKNRRISWKNPESVEENVEEDEDEDEEAVSVEDPQFLLKANSFKKKTIDPFDPLEEEKRQRFLKTIEEKRKILKVMALRRDQAAEQRCEEPVQILDLTERVKELNEELGEDGFIDVPKYCKEMAVNQQIFSEDSEDTVLVNKEELQEESSNLPPPKKSMMRRVTSLVKNPFKRFARKVS